MRIEVAIESLSELRDELQNLQVCYTNSMATKKDLRSYFDRGYSLVEKFAASENMKQEVDRLLLELQSVGVNVQLPSFSPGEAASSDRHGPLISNLTKLHDRLVDIRMAIKTNKPLKRLAVSPGFFNLEVKTTQDKNSFVSLLESFKDIAKQCGLQNEFEFTLALSAQDVTTFLNIIVGWKQNVKDARWAFALDHCIASVKDAFPKVYKAVNQQAPIYSALYLEKKAFFSTMQEVKEIAVQYGLQNEFEYTLIQSAPDAASLLNMVAGWRSSVQDGKWVFALDNCLAKIRAAFPKEYDQINQQAPIYKPA